MKAKIAGNASKYDIQSSHNNRSADLKIKELEGKLVPFTKEELLQIRDQTLPVTVYVRPLTRTVHLEVNQVRFMKMYFA